MVKYSHLTIEELMMLVEGHYKRNNYTAATPQTLTLGIMEEVGELAQEILLQHSPDYTPRQEKTESSIPYEIGDIIVYCLALCLKLDIMPTFHDLVDS